MYPARFEYARPATLDEAIRLLQDGNGEAKLLAGGHSLLPLMKLRLLEPATLIDIGRLKDSLSYVRRENGTVAVGAMTTHHALETSDELRQSAPVVAEAAAMVGDVQVRNRGTIGGSLAHADPAGDLPAVMLALGAEMVARGPGGQRVIPADEFFVDLLTTALGPDEILVEVRLPAQRTGSGAAYRSLEHPASGYAVVGVAAVVRLEGSAIAEARLGVTGASSSGPYRARAVEEALVGQQVSPDVLAKAASHAVDGVDVASDLFAAADYRSHLAQVYARRALAAAVERAQA